MRWCNERIKKVYNTCALNMLVITMMMKIILKVIHPMECAEEVRIVNHFGKDTSTDTSIAREKDSAII